MSSRSLSTGETQAVARFNLVVILSLLVNLLPAPQPAHAARAPAPAQTGVRASAVSAAPVIPPPAWLPIFWREAAAKAPLAQEPVQLALRSDRSSLPADGESLAYLAVFAYGEDGEPLPDGAPVSWATSLGELGVGDEGRATKDGLAWVALQAGETPGVAVVTATVGVSAQQRINLEIAAPEAAVYRLDEDEGTRDGAETALELARNTVREAGEREAIFVEGPYHRLDFAAWGLTFRADLVGGAEISVGHYLKEVRLGAATWLTRTDVEPVVDGNAVRYEWADQRISEEYVALDAGVEQRLVFTQPLPANGADVTLVGTFEAPLAARLNVSGTVVYFYGPRGREWLAQYGPALAYDAAGHLAILEIRLSGTDVEIVLPGAWLARATYPVVVDPLLGSRLTLAASSLINRYTPDVAYNPDSDQYLATWLFASETTVGVHARRVWADGAPDGGIFTLYQVSGPPVSQWDAPRAAYDPTSDKYLVTWAVDSGQIASALRSRQVPASGTTLGPVQTVHGGSHANPAVAADTLNGGYLVAWDDTAGNVYARRVGADGAPTGNVINVATGAAVEQDPDVAFSSAAEEYLVVWEQDSDVYGRRVASDGGLPGNAFALTTATGTQADPALDYGSASGAFLVTWSESSDVKGQRVASDGDLLGGVLDVATGALTQFAPDVGYDALTEDWLTVWRGVGQAGFPKPWGQVLHEEGTLSGNNQLLVKYSGETGSRAATSGAGAPSGNHLVVWDDVNNTAIYGQRFRPLQAGFTATPTHGVAPLTVQFTTTATPAGVADQGRWFFGDGATSPQPYLQHTYTQAGVFTVSGRMTDTQTGEWDVLTRTAYISVTPVAGFTATPRQGAAPLTVHFSDTATSGVDQWYWTFGVGDASASQHPVYTYTGVGVYTVTQRVSDTASGGWDVLTRTAFITVFLDNTPPFNPFLITETHGVPSGIWQGSVNAPVFEWEAGRDDASGVAGYYVYFGPNEAVTPTTFITDTTYATGTLPAEGSYYLRLRTADQAGNVSQPETVFIFRYDATPPATPTVSEVAGIPDGVWQTTHNLPRFRVEGGDSDTPSGWDRYQYQWMRDFGAAEPVTVTSGIMTSAPVTVGMPLIQQMGQYTFRARSLDRAGNASDWADYAVWYGPLAAAFSADVTEGEAPLHVTFYNDSTPAPLLEAFLWNLGDDVTSTLRAPEHTYAASGVYTVSLRVMVRQGSPQAGGGVTDTLTQTHFITVTPPTLWPDFIAAPRVGTAPLTVQFTNTTQAQSPVLTFIWDFGDGSPVSHAVDPSHVYAANGAYTVSLTAETATATATTTHTREIIVADLSPCAWSFQPVTPAWWDERYLNRQPLTVAVGAQGLTFVPGVTTTLAFTLDTQALITHGLALESGADLRVTYWDGATWTELPRTLAFVDTPTSTLFFPLQATVEAHQVDSNYYLYYGSPDAGAPPTLFLDTSGDGAFSHVEGDAAITLTLAFAGSPRRGPAPLTVTFTDTSTAEGGAIVSREWTFGDGGDPVHPSPISNTYTTPGLYQVELTVVAENVTGAVTGTLTRPAYVIVNGRAGVTVTVGLSQTAEVTATICPSHTAQGFPSPDGRAWISFPTGAVAEPAVVRYTPQPRGAYLTRFDLRVETLGGAPLVAFDPPLEVTFDYSAWGLPPVAAQGLRAFLLPDAGQAEPLSSAVDTTAETFWVQVPHLSGLAVAGPNPGGPPPLGPTLAPYETDLFTGAAAFALPLQAAPGTAGVQPNLTLAYNSRLATEGWDEQAGVVGHGFSLDMGYVAYAQESCPWCEPPDHRFELVLNGARLKLVDTGDGEHYRTDPETFWRVRRFEGANHGVDLLDYRWEVTTQDGTRYFFGSSAGSVQRSPGWLSSWINVVLPWRYMLDRVEDPHGNYFVVTYTKDVQTFCPSTLDELGDCRVTPVGYDRALYLHEIAYTGNESTGLTPRRHVSFDYRSRAAYLMPDWPAEYENNPFTWSFFYTDYLHAVRVWVDDEQSPVRRYELVHQIIETGDEQRPRDRHLQMASVTLYGDDGSTLPITTFTYGQNGAKPAELSGVDNGYGGQVHYTFDQGRVQTRRVQDAQTAADHTFVYTYEGRDAGGGHRQVQVSAPEGDYTRTTFHTDGDKRGRVEKVTRGRAWDLFTWTETGYAYDVWSGYGSPFVYPTLASTRLPSGAMQETTYHYDVQDSCGDACYGNLKWTRSQLNGSADTLETVWHYYPPGPHYLPGRVQVETRAFDPDGSHATQARTYYDYQDDGDLTMVWLVDGLGGQRTAFGYDAYGNLKTVTDRAGNTTTYTYDPDYWSFPEGVSYANGFEEAANYDPAFGLPSWQTDVNGLQTDYDYDPFGRLDLLTQPGGVTTDYAYTDGPTGLTVDVSASGPGETPLESQAVYNGLGQLTRSSVAGVYDEGSASTVDRQYDALGRVEQVSLPHAGAPTHWTTYQYDAVGRIKQVDDPVQGLQMYQYLLLGPGAQAYTWQDGAGRQWQYVLDSLGRVTQVTEDPDGANLHTAYRYDVFGHLTWVQDAAGNETTMSYDGAGRKTAMDDPDMGHWEYGYDLAGNLKWQTDANGNQMTFSYDALNRLTGKQAEAYAVSYTYDEGTGANLGRRTRMDDGSGYTEYLYDNLGRLESQTKYISAEFYVELLDEEEWGTVSFGGTYETGFSYDGLGRPKTLTYPSGEVITYTYHPQGTVAGLAGDGGEWDPAAYASGLSYNVAGQPSGLTFGNGLQTTWSYQGEVAGLPLEGINTPGVQDVSYTYDPAGYLYTASDGAPAPWGFGLDYDYDPLARLASVEGSSALSITLTMHYDELSNAVEREDVFTWDPGHALPHAPDGINAGSITFLYDANGNRIEQNTDDTVITYTYDPANHLTRVLENSEGFTQTVHYVYDGDGALALRVYSECDYTIYGGGDYEEQGLDIDNGEFGRFCYPQYTSYYRAAGQAIASRRVYPYVEEDVPIYTSTVRYLHRDYLGNLTEVTDEGGNLTGSARYDAFGIHYSDNIPSDITTDRYTGSILDPDTGLYKIGARWYDPGTALWLTPDAVVPDVNNPIAWNPYAFNYQNPANYSDPSGHFPIWDILDIGSFFLSARDFIRSPSWANLGWWALDAVSLLPVVSFAWVRHAGKVDDVGDTRRIIEIGSGGGENLLRIAEARPGSLVVGVDYANDAATLAKIRAAYSPYRNIEVVRANYLRAPFGTGQFDEVIAIAPGSVKDYVTDAAKTATNLVSAHGRFYVVTDLGAAPTAIQAIEQGLKSRGLRGQIVSGFRDVRDIARGLNPLGIPLESAFFSGYDEVWEIFVQLGP